MRKSYWYEIGLLYRGSHVVTREACMNSTSSLNRVTQNLAVDQILTAFPEVDEPFKNKRDVVDRLLPYHIYQHPQCDLDALRGSKGKGKATEFDLLKEEIKGMRPLTSSFMLEC